LSNQIIPLCSFCSFVEFVETLFRVRAIEALERMASSAAKQLLDSLAQGAPEARLTQEAKASLERLAVQR
jgi:hypothetical protein